MKSTSLGGVGFFVVVGFFFNKKLVYKINLYQLVLICAIVSTQKEKRRNNI